MTLKDWKEQNRYRVKDLTELFDISEPTVKRILATNECKKLADAHTIVAVTKGEVDFCDLLNGDCPTC